MAMSHQAVAAHVVVRAPDAEGYHRAPVSSCHGAAVLYFDKKTHRFEKVQDEAQLAELNGGTRFGRQDDGIRLWCRRCNRQVN